MLDQQNTSVQALLHLADALRVGPRVKYRALCVLADVFLPSPHAAREFPVDSATTWIGLAGSAICYAWEMLRSPQENWTDFMDKVDIGSAPLILGKLSFS